MTGQEAPAALGWDGEWAATYAARAGGDHRRPARVVAAHKDRWVLGGLGGPDGRAAATIAGRLRFEALGPADLPAVGDWVVVSGPVEEPVIQAVLTRRTAVTRSGGDGSRRGGGRIADEQVLAANVDTVVVVAGLDRDFNVRRIERYLAVAWSSGASPLLVLNKADIDVDLEGHRTAAEAVAPGVDVVAISALVGSGVDVVAGRLRPGSTAVVVGSSGVGKSTLINALVGEDRQATGAVRTDDARGRHTTTARELVALPSGALLIDTPGLRALDVSGAADGFDAAFADVAELAQRCRFRDCRHEGEPGCAVREAVGAGLLDEARVAGYRKLERELAYEARRNDPRAQAEERRRWRTIQRSVGQVYRVKYGEEG
jgi:ribosome biogenesis GTPase